MTVEQWTAVFNQLSDPAPAPRTPNIDGAGAVDQHWNQHNNNNSEIKSTSLSAKELPQIVGPRNECN